MTETNDLNRQAIGLVNYRGGFVWRNNTGMIRRASSVVRFGYVGSGDVIGMYHGIFISIETKTGYDKASDKQLEFARRVKSNSGFACFVRDIDEVIEFLDSIDALIAQEISAQEIPF